MWIDQGWVRREVLGFTIKNNWEFAYKWDWWWNMLDFNDCWYVIAGWNVKSLWEHKRFISWMICVE